jgi:hypothetical protein
MISNVWVMVILTGTGRLKTRTIDKSAVVILVGIKGVMMTINEWTACLSINWLNSKKLLSIWERREGADGRSQEPGEFLRDFGGQNAQKVFPHGEENFVAHGRCYYFRS